MSRGVDCCTGSPAAVHQRHARGWWSCYLDDLLIGALKITDFSPHCHVGFCFSCSIPPSPPPPPPPPHQHIIITAHHHHQHILNKTPSTQHDQINTINTQHNQHNIMNTSSSQHIMINTSSTQHHQPKARFPWQAQHLEHLRFLLHGRRST